MNIFLQLTINGILLGGLYAAMTLGFSTIWGVMRLINLAHGEFIMMGAFVAWTFFNPTREQNLTIGGVDPAESKTTLQVVLIIIALVFAYMMSETLFVKRRLHDKWSRLGFGGLVSGIVTIILYFVWQDAGFNDIDLPVRTLILVSLALSLGFILSHFLLVVPIPNIWLRRAISYGAAVGVVAIGHDIWRSSDYRSLDPFLMLPVVFPIFFALGYMLQKLLLNRLVEGPYLTMLLVTFSIAIMMQNIGLQIYAADPRRINVQYGTALHIGSLTIPPTKLITVLIALVLVIGLVLFLRYTRTGYAIRAAAQNKMAARLMGIDIYETYAITFGISIALTGLAGAMMGTFLPIAPNNGTPWTLRAFSIVALGGLGKVQGVVAGGLLLGLAESYVGGYIGAAWAIAVAFIVLVVVLVVRPQGVTGGLLLTEEA
jgi:branched-chain amino acid transport system permease protein